METEHVHRATSDDGTEIVGRVVGAGPPLVLVHGAVADGDSEWAALVPLLADRFTCYLPSTRNRGQSGRHPDMSRDARVRDVAAFVDSIGAPVGLVGTSGGGMLALGAAARATSVEVLAVREPPVFEVIDPDARSRLHDITDLAARAIAEGRPVDGVMSFFEWIANDAEIAALEGEADEVEEFAAYLPVDVEEFREGLAFEGPSPTDPSTLARITAPTLVTFGTDTALGGSRGNWFRASVRHLVDHIPDVTVREIPGAGHLGHLVHPQREADALIDFLATTSHRLAIPSHHRS